MLSASRPPQLVSDNDDGMIAPSQEERRWLVWTVNCTTEPDTLQRSEVILPGGAASPLAAVGRICISKHR